MLGSKILVKERLLFLIAVAMIKKNDFKNPSVIPTVKITVVHLCNMVKLAM